MNETAITLYRYSPNGMRKWAVSVDGSCVCVLVGKENGTMHLASCTYAEAKNIGKKNETTAEKQAIKEAAAMARLKIKEGWHETIETAYANTVNTDRVMLAYNYKDVKPEDRKNLFPCDGQYKLNGMRATARKTNYAMELWSRRNNPIRRLPHIERELRLLEENGMCENFDGELYHHGISLQKIVSIAKRADHPNTADLKWHVYDVNTPQPWTARRVILDRLRSMIAALDLRHIEVVPTTLLHSEADARWFLQCAKEEGYEGAMYRQFDEEYYNSQNEADRNVRALTKDKGEMDSDEFKIIGGEADVDGGMTLLLKTKQGGKFKARMQGTHAERAALWEMNCVGKYATVNFFGLSEYGIPQNPTAEVIRDYE